MLFSAPRTPEPDPRLRDLIDSSLDEHPGVELDVLLREAAQSAGAIAGCSYSAISVLGPGGRTERFIAHGVSSDVAARIGRMPDHRGLLGVVVDDAETVRTDDIGLDPRTAGLPAGHPPIRSLLGVPIMLRGRVAGGLFLSRPDGRDGFEEADEPVAHAIASAASNIIEKSRTAAENQRRDRWLTGTQDLIRGVAAGRHEHPLNTIAQRLLEIADADLVSIVTPGASEDTVVVAAAAGANAETWDGYILPTRWSLAARVMRTGTSMIVPAVDDTHMPAEIRRLIDIESALIVPLRGNTSPRSAAISIGRRAGRRRFSSGEEGMATMFAGQVALALELAEVQARRDQVALIEERDRIARDLHDHVIQRLFAVGLTLQSAGMHLAEHGSDKIQTSVDEIDETIKQIRSTIYRLTVPIVSAHGSIRLQAERLIDDLELALGFRPGLEVDGPIEFGINETVIDDGIAVLREALTNVARHANATRARVDITIERGVLAIGVEDDGEGLGEVTRRSGLSNMRTRAERRGGSMTVDSGARGTRLVWSVPVEARDTTGCGAE